MASAGRTESKLRDNGPLEIIVAVNTHRVRVQRPVVHHARKRRDFPIHQFLGFGGIVPERGILRAHVQIVETLDCLIPVKDASSAGQRPA